MTATFTSPLSGTERGIGGEVPSASALIRAAQRDFAGSAGYLSAWRALEDQVRVIPDSCDRVAARALLRRVFVQAARQLSVDPNPRLIPPVRVALGDAAAKNELRSLLSWVEANLSRPLITRLLAIALTVAQSNREELP